MSEALESRNRYRVEEWVHIISQCRSSELRILPHIPGIV